MLDLLYSPGPAMNTYLVFSGNLTDPQPQEVWGGTATGRPRQSQPQQVRGRQYDGGHSRVTGGPQGT